MKSRLIVVVSIIACTMLSACSLIQRAMPGATMSDADVVGLLNTVNRSEIDAGQLAKDRASSSQVRAYASQMVNEHQEKMQMANQVAIKMGVQPHKPALAQAMENAHLKAMEELRQKSGRDFDKTYLQYQIKMHQQSVGLVDDTAESADNFELKRFLREARPDLQKHLAIAQSIQQQLLTP